MRKNFRARSQQNPPRMIDRKQSVRWLLGLWLCGLVCPNFVLANPSGPTVTAGQANISGLGTPQVTIHQQTQQAIINWNQFNIGQNEVTRFLQPSSSAIALNRIFDVNPSQIFGRLEANGSLILLNRNGIMFGPNAQVNVNGLIASSLNLTNEQFLAGQYLFQGQIGNGLIKNAGQIHGGANGIFLLSPQVINTGLITSPEGNVSLGAGTTAYVSTQPDGNGLMVEVQAPAGEARNLGQIFADGGTVSLAGLAVNQEGFIQSNSVKEKNGVIELVAQQELTLESGSRTLATGDASVGSSGGTIIALSDKRTGSTRFKRGAVIDVSGGENGGDGGFAEVSGASVELGGLFHGQAKSGFRGGEFLIDPVNLTVNNAALESFNGSGASEIVFEAENNITVESVFDPGTNWQWPLTEGHGTLKFVAGNTIRFNDLFGGATLGDSSFTELFDPSAPLVLTPWDIVADAGRDIIFGQVDRITRFGVERVGKVINGGVLIASGGANIRLDAKRDISLVPLTVDGKQDVAAGTQGTISAIQGNVTINAGRNLIAPAISNSLINFLPGGIRIERQGNVALTVAASWLGSGPGNGADEGPGLLLSDGSARISVGGQIGREDQPASFTIGKADIVMEAGRSVYLGLLQDKGLVESPILTGNATLTVDPDNRFVLTARTGDIHLNPSLPGLGENPIQDLRAFYPATFKANALAGSIIIEKPVTFWPSVTGDVTLDAMTDIRGNPGTLQVGTGKNAAGDSLLGCNASGCEGIALNGQALNREELLQLGFSEAQIGVLLIEVLETQTKNAALPIKLFDSDLAAMKNAVENANRFQLKAALEESAMNEKLLPPRDVVFLAEQGMIERLNFDLKTSAFPKNITISAGQDLRSFTASIAVPEGTRGLIKAGRDIDMTSLALPSGILFAGRGVGRVFATRNLNLADSLGIQYQASFTPTFLADQGGLLDIRVGEKLNMTQSRLVSWNGASILIHGTKDSPLPGSAEFDDFQDAVGGAVNVGTNAPPSGFGGPTGILTVLGGDITIRSTGNIGVNRSRVATFGGGNLSLTSFSGNINAGFGGANDLVTFLLQNNGVDANGNPFTQNFEFQVPGSGIFTFHPDDPFPVIFPKFDTPTITALKNEKIKAEFFGRNTAFLDKQITAAVKEREPVFDQIFLDFINTTPIKAGDVTLTATNALGTGAVVVPPAGIRGRRITINSDILDLQGGTIAGLAQINSGTVSGQSAGSFAGSASGAVKASGDSSGGTLAPLGGSTGTVTTSASSTSGGASTTSASTEKISEEATKTAKKEVLAQAQTDEAKEGESGGGGSREQGLLLGTGRGVTIEVEVKKE